MDFGVIIGIIGVVVAIVFGLPSYISAYYAKKDHDKKNQDTNDQEDQIHERFANAINQLGAIDKDGNPVLEIRLGAISSLEIIADKSDEYYWLVIENLTAYLRKNSHVEYGERTFHYEYSNAYKESIEIEDRIMQDRVSFDIHTIINVIRRRRHFFNSGEDEQLDLRGTNLREANFQGVNLKGANLQWAYLGGANFGEANLSDAFLYEANLSSAYLQKANLLRTILERSNLKKANISEAHLEGAFLYKAYLQGAFLYGANLEGADLYEAHLEKAELRKAYLKDALLARVHLDRAILLEANLCGANLKEAHLANANLYKANLSDTILNEANFFKAILRKANLKRAILSGAKNLTVEQLSKVETLYGAYLDPELEAELRANNLGHLLDVNLSDES